MSAIPKTALERILELIANAKAQMEIAKQIGGSLAMKQAQHLKGKYVEELDMENAFEVLLEKIENGQKNGMGRTGQVYVLGMVTYALERAGTKGNSQKETLFRY